MKTQQTITSQIKHLLRASITKLINNNLFKTNINIITLDINVDKTKNSKFGDFTTNVGLIVSKNVTSDINIIQEIVNNMDQSIFSKIEIVKPGFINMYLNDKTKSAFLKEVVKDDNFGQFHPKKLKYNIEFVSANPTGLLHIGHARNGSYGDSLARIMQAWGVSVDREYYINDGGSQVEKLGMSVLIRYLQSFNKKVELPEDSYKAEEILEVAAKLKEKYGDKFINAKFNESKILTEEANELVGKFSKDYLLDIIKQHLGELNVSMDIWAPESDIYKYKLIDKTLDILKNAVYKKDGATWLRTTDFNDDKDRVLIKSGGSYTYFTPDIAYHNLKLSRGYDKIFNIWGADHKSYVDRMTIAVQLLGFKKEQIQVLIMQMVKLTKNGQEFKMSKRSGNSFTTKDLLDLIGKDASRWFLVCQSLDSHIEIDVEKAKQWNSENGLYYVQYAYVRINQILSKAEEVKPGKESNLLTQPIESEIINQLFFFKPTIKNIAKNCQVHKLCLYLTTLAKLFHNYYETTKINDPSNTELTSERLFLILAVAKVIKNGLNLLGIDVVESM